MKRILRGLVFLAVVTIMMLMLIPSLYANEIRIKVDGEQVQLEVPPFIQDGRTMVPLRAIAEMLDIEIDWDEEERSITYINHEGLHFTLVIGHEYVMISRQVIFEEVAASDENLVLLDAPPMIVGDRTFVPLRFIAESLGIEVDFVEGVVFLTTISDVGMDQTVWVAAGGGDIYHSIEDCGNMNPARAAYMMRQTAQDEGLRACLRCW